MADSPAHTGACSCRLLAAASRQASNNLGRKQDEISARETSQVRTRNTWRKMTWLSNKKFHLVVCKSVLHVNGNLRITITILMNCIDSHCDIVVYDSLYAYVSQATKMPLATLIKTSWKELRIKIANTHKQAGSDDCGSLLYCPG